VKALLGWPLILLTLVSSRLETWGQPTAPAPPCQWYSLSPVELRKEPTKPEKPAPRIEPARPRGLIPEVSLYRSDMESGQYAWLERTGIITRTEQISRDGFAGWAMGALENTFSPEVLNFGRTQATCSLVTAFKRKNPFCLLNPVVLHVTW
jgi:hypothetical protein